MGTKRRRLLFLPIAFFALALMYAYPKLAGNTETVYGNIVDVVSRRIYPGKVLICDGKIVEIIELKKEECNNDAFILPGFVDSHIHIESTLMIPQHYARMAVANGVVAAVCDPHEIANVLGVEGIEFMISNSKDARFNFNYTVSSCVPSTQFETAGAVIDAKAVKELLSREEIVALAEVMNVPGVVYDNPDLAAKLQAAKDAGKPIDGHSPKVTGEMLKKYVDAGVSTDHECVSLEEAKEKLSLGMNIIIREGSAACDFEALYPLIAEYPGKTLFCSDDMYPDDIESIGYINGMVRRAVAKGMPLWETLESASVTPVRHYNLKSGLLQAGDQADFIIVDNLEDFNILSTYVQGKEVYTSVKGIIEENFTVSGNNEVNCPNKFNAKMVTPEVLKVKWEDRELKVIVATEGSLLTGMTHIKSDKDADGNIITPVNSGIAKIVVYDRYTESAPQVAYIKGFGLKEGALASTIAHDSHNIIAIGCNDNDLACAINCLIREKGGIAVYCDGKMECLPLPIAGLMTNLQPHDVALKHEALKQFAAELGCPFNAPFMTLSFMALPVIPDLKLTDMGLFDVETFGFTPIWKNQ